MESKPTCGGKMKCAEPARYDCRKNRLEKINDLFQKLESKVPSQHMVTYRGKSTRVSILKTAHTYINFLEKRIAQSQNPTSAIQVYDVNPSGDSNSVFQALKQKLISAGSLQEPMRGQPTKIDILNSTIAYIDRLSNLLGDDSRVQFYSSVVRPKPEMLHTPSANPLMLNSNHLMPNPFLSTLMPIPTPTIQFPLEPPVGMSFQEWNAAWEGIKRSLGLPSQINTVPPDNVTLPQ